MSKMSNVHVALQEQGKSQEEIENTVLGEGCYYMKGVGFVGEVQEVKPFAKNIMKSILGFDY